MQRQRPLPAQEGPVHRRPRPELRRLRPHAHRRERLLRLPHHQARPLSVAQPGQRLAAGAHPLRDLRRRLGAAADHADVLRGRPADQELPDPRRRAERGADPRPDRAPGHRRLRPARQPRLPLRHRPARPSRDAVREQRAEDAAKERCNEHDVSFSAGRRPGGSSLVVRRETASQTAGPYVHIGLAPAAAGFDIFENNFGSVLVDAADQGRADPHRGPRLRRHRHRAEGRADRDLAGQRRRQVRPPGRPPAGQVARSALSRLGPQLHRLRQRRLHLRHRQARRGRGPQRPASWRRTSTPGSSPAASTSASTPASTSATRPRPTPRTR